MIGASMLRMMQPVEVRARREALGLSQERLADWLDVKRATVSRWETGRQPIPDGVAGDLLDLEASVGELVAAYVRAGHAGESLLISDDDDVDFPACSRRVALARALFELRSAGVVDVAVVSV